MISLPSWNGEEEDKWCLNSLGQLISTVLLFVCVLGVRMEQGPGGVGGEVLQEAWTTLASVVGRGSLQQCTGLEFEGCEQGGSPGNEKGDG